MLLSLTHLRRLKVVAAYLEWDGKGGEYLHRPRINTRLCPPKVSRKRIRHKRPRASVVVASYKCDIGFQGETRGTEGNTSISGWVMVGNLVYEPDFRGFLECGGNDGPPDTRNLIQHYLVDESF